MILTPITFLVQFPKEIKVDAQKLEDLFKSYDYDDVLPNRLIKDTAQGVTVTFDLTDWKHANMEDGAPDLSNSEIFKEELISCLEGEQLVTWGEASQIVVRQLEPNETPKLNEPEVKPICPVCCNTISPEAYEAAKKKYPQLFGEKPSQKVISCPVCSEEILVLPDVKEMAKSIKEHAKTHFETEEDASDTEKSFGSFAELQLSLTQALLEEVAPPTEAAKQ